jgi:hypothetical protein
MTYTDIRATKRVEINRCYEFTFTQGLLLAFVNTLLITVGPIAVILQNLGFPGLFNNLVQNQQEAAGCEVNGFGVLGHPMNNIIETSLSNVGLSFQSSILQSGTYSNTVYLSQSSILQSGTYSNTVYLSEATIGGSDLGGLFVERYGKTIVQFLNSAKILFNADYRIINGVLYFERKDAFFDNTNELVDLEQVSTPTNPVCYMFTTDPEFAIGDYSFVSDSREKMGNEALGDYSDIIIWNEPFNPNRKDTNEVNIPFGAAKFTGDVYDTNVLLQNGERPIGWIITSRDAEPWEAPKVVIVNAIDNDAFTENATVVHAVDGNGERRYNYPFYIGENNNLNPAEENEELYQNFYHIDDPRETPIAPYEISEFTFLATCDQINLVRENGINVHVKTRFGKGFPTEIDINYQNKTLTLKDIKIIS